MKKKGTDVIPAIKNDGKRSGVNNKISEEFHLIVTSTSQRKGPLRRSRHRW
jgi:hypothetical protein